MRALVVMIGLAGVLLAQGELVELEGWRTMNGDNPRWAQREFDDSQWPPSPPPLSEVGIGTGAERLWYRTTFRIPEWWAGRDLAVGLWKLDDGYEVFVNGVKLGQHGTPDRVYSFRPLAFGIPRALVRDGIVPAAEVGGDFYQVLDREDGSRVVLVGDVSGKGLRAALLVSVAIGILRRERSSSPAAILRALNEALVGHTGGSFVTCCCARFAPNGAVVVANAGHPAPYADGREVEIEGGLPLGVTGGADYVEAPVGGEYFTFVSDGVIEAANAAGELFGFERTQAISARAAAEIAEAAQAWGQNDDITVVTVRRNL